MALACYDALEIVGLSALFYYYFLPLRVKIPGLKTKFKTDKKLEKASGPVGRRINQRFLESEQR